MSDELPPREARGTRLLVGAGLAVLILSIAFAATRIDSLQGDPFEARRGTPAVAPELAGITARFNGAPETLAELSGSVVWVDFWTMSCINCIRSIPFVQAMYEHYRDFGLSIIGVHSPEFAFEEKPEVVADAIERFGITYPVVLDAEMDTWRAYRNRFWPRVYLVDAEGKIRFDHIGEGGHAQIEANVRQLLDRAGRSLPEETLSMPDKAITSGATPERYLGTGRGLYDNPKGVFTNRVYRYAFEGPTETVSLSGDWLLTQEYAESAVEGATMSIKVRGRDVFVVASSESRASVRILADGDVAWGADSDGGDVFVKEERLYRLIEGEGVFEGTLTLRVGKGVRLFAFTFG